MKLIHLPLQVDNTLLNYGAENKVKKREESKEDRTDLISADVFTVKQITEGKGKEMSQRRLWK